MPASFSPLPPQAPATPSPPPSTSDSEARQFTLLVTGRCRRCAERVHGGTALRGMNCVHCGTPTARTKADIALVMALFESRARTRTWVATLLAAAIVLFAGWAPAVGGIVVVGSFFWVQLAVVRPAARLLSVRRRMVATWTFRLLAASFSALSIALVELLTLVPVLGLVGKAGASAANVAVLAWAAHGYMRWQTRRESRHETVGWGEYVLLAFAGVFIVVGSTVALWAASWVTTEATSALAGVDALAAGPPLGAESLEWASTIGLGAATGTRAATFLLLSGVLSQVAPGIVPQQLHFIGSPWGLGIALGLLVIESATERDDDLQTTFGFAAGGSRVAAAALLGILGSGQPPSSTAAIIAGAIGAAVAVAAAGSRSWLHSALRELETEAFSPRRWLNRLEEGGVAGLAVAVYVAPMLAVGFVIVGFAVTLVAAGMARRFEAKWRRPCPACAAVIRVEATGCTRCGRDVSAARDVITNAFGITASTWRSALAGATTLSARGGRRG